MGNTFEDNIKRVVKKIIRTEYPQCTRPQMLRAKVSKIEPEGYKLQVLDSELNRDKAYPEIPRVKSSGTYEVGDMVVITFIGGKDVYIVGSA